MRHGIVSSSGAQAVKNAAADSVAGFSEPYPRLFAKPANPKAADAALAAKLAVIANARVGIDDPPPPQTPPRADRDAIEGSTAGIPAGYTYFGQFVIHDMTRSEFLSAGRGVVNRFSGVLDLDSVYSGGPALCPHFYHAGAESQDSLHLFRMGKTGPATEGSLPHSLPFDLPRIDIGGRGLMPESEKEARKAEESKTELRCVAPLVADSRNDDNLVTAQLLVLFTSIHNRVATALKAKRPLSGRESFTQARRFVLRCYRQIVLHDYIRRLVPDPFYKDIASQDPQLIPKDGQYLPREFVFGAARLPHAMSRREYRTNAFLKPANRTLNELLNFSSNDPSALLPLPANWVVDWQNFFPIYDQQPPQMARPLSPVLAPAMVYRVSAPGSTPGSDKLAFRDLWRCYEVELPTGQECARELRTRIGPALSKITGKQDPIPVIEGEAMMPARVLQDHNESLTEALRNAPDFLNETPLSYYLAQEAWLHGDNGRHAGPLGAYILAVAFRYALKKSSNPDDGDWDPSLPPSGVASMPDFIRLLDKSDDEIVALVP